LSKRQQIVKDAPHLDAGPRFKTPNSGNARWAFITKMLVLEQALNAGAIQASLDWTHLHILGSSLFHVGGRCG